MYIKLNLGKKCKGGVVHDLSRKEEHRIVDQRNHHFRILLCVHVPAVSKGGLESTETFRYWGSFVLILTLVSIVAHIIISIIFNIVFRITTGEKEPTFADELDKLIDLKAFRNSFFVFILGFLFAMGSLVIDQPSQVMFVILIASGFISDVTGSITKLYHYRKGV
ncbi:hypothetical protein [Paenibacillus beijingensis]|uniref:hypothetical protein n=1 Tax=Paenibacillus beijingensis TaxID=1126833 RepID=UPI001EE69751|nr:hypothetical protein [Paenibacillus beijingensis]